jgi:transcription antitermination factor NusG
MKEGAVGALHALHPALVGLGVGERWFVVNSQPKREMPAFINLANQGFRLFMPKRLKTVRHSRMVTTVIAPFFPGYLFLALDLARHRWRSVNGTFGVSRIIMANEQPQPVPHGVVEAMIAATDPEGLLRLGEGLLKAGNSVRFVAGPFAEQLGRLEHLDDTGRARVLLEIMGCFVPVRARREDVAAA